MLEMVSLEDHIEEVVVLDVLDPPCVYTFICVEIKTNTETVALGMFQKVQRTLGTQARFFLFLSWKESLRVSQDRFFLTYSSSLYLQFFTFCLTLTFYQPYESMSGPIAPRVLT